MLKSELNKAVDDFRTKTKEALQTMYDELNHGQQKKIASNEKVKALFDLYRVEYSE